MKKERNTKVMSITVDKEVYDKISELVNNKSKFTEWLFINYLDNIGIDVKNIKF